MHNNLVKRYTTILWVARKRAAEPKDLHDIPAAFNSFEDKDAVKFYYFWNATRTHITRRKLNDWFKANQIPYKFQ